MKRDSTLIVERVGTVYLIYKNHSEICKTFALISFVCWSKIKMVCYRPPPSVNERYQLNKSLKNGAFVQDECRPCVQKAASKEHSVLGTSGSFLQMLQNQKMLE